MTAWQLARCMCYHVALPHFNLNPSPSIARCSWSTKNSHLDRAPTGSSRQRQAPLAPPSPWPPAVGATPQQAAVQMLVQTPAALAAPWRLVTSRSSQSAASRQSSAYPRPLARPLTAVAAAQHAPARQTLPQRWPALALRAASQAAGTALSQPAVAAMATPAAAGRRAAGARRG